MYLAKSGALNAGLDLTERLHDGRHRLLKAVLLVVPQVQLTPHHRDDRHLQLRNHRNIGQQRSTRATQGKIICVPKAAAT